MFAGVGPVLVSAPSCDLSGVEKLSALHQLKVLHCGVTSLQPVADLTSGLKIIEIRACKSVQEGVLELPHV